MLEFVTQSSSYRLSNIPTIVIGFTPPTAGVTLVSPSYRDQEEEGQTVARPGSHLTTHQNLTGHLPVLTAVRRQYSPTSDQKIGNN